MYSHPLPHTIDFIYRRDYYVQGDAMLLFQQMASLIYFSKILYGLLSLPFVIFLSEIVIQLFTTAKPTGYDRDGNIVPKLKKLAISYEELKEEDPKDTIDIEEIL